MDPSLVRFRAVVEGALAHLESRRQEINDLNVFPVADGDTGDNMALTLRAVLVEVDRLAADEHRLIDEIGRDEIVESVARAALLGARGNSGVILSQLIRGAAEELVSRPGELVDPIMIGAAMARAAQRAYESVRQPAEGTMLTVMREMAQRIALELPNVPNPRLGVEWNAVLQDELIADILERALQAGEEAVRRGPELLPVLKDAGVVDAGGHAVTILFAGVVAALRGTEGPEIPRQAAVRVTHPEHDSSTFRYCTNFAVTGTNLDAGDHAGRLEAIGDSVLVVGDAATLKIHVHTDDPEAATALFAPPHVVSHLDVADMREQVADRSARVSGDGVPMAAETQCGVLAVASGVGMVRLYEGLGAQVLDGGPTMNPSTYELLAGIHAVAAHEVIVLPNSPNVRMAADRAAELSEKPVRVVPTTAAQQGLAALLSFDAGHGCEANVAALAKATEGLSLGGVAPAAKDDAQGRFEAGEAVGYAGGELVAHGDPAETFAETVRRVAAEAELLTVLAGEAAPLGRQQLEALLPKGVELDFQQADQPAWWWLLSAE